MFFEEAKRNKYLNRVKYKVCLTIENKKSHEENIQNYNDPLNTM
jgi:hypothetical protein